jgi:cold-inducible RNA-binding protein
LNNKLYVGSLGDNVSQTDLETMFAAFGKVISAQLAMDRETGKPKDFAFVEMSSAEEAQAAIAGLNGKNVNGQDIVVNEARPREPRAGGTASARNGGGRDGKGGGGRKRY